MKTNIANRLGIAAVLLSSILVASAQSQNGKTPTFERHLIDAAFEKGYQASVADINSDGRVDVIALSTMPSQLVWYRNPDWAKFTVTSDGKQNIDVAPYDVDGDGDQDLALATEFDLGNSTSGGSVYWCECPADPTTDQEWPMHFIDAVPTSHRVRWSEIRGDGRKALLNLPIIGVGAKAPEYAVGVQLKAYTIPKDPANDAWKSLLIDDTLNTAHGMCIIRWNDDSYDDVLTASFDGVWLFQSRPESHSFVKHPIGVGNRGARPKQGSSEVGLGNLKATGSRFVATIEPWHGSEVVVYTPDRQEELPWRRTVIDDTFNDGHGLVCVDVDNDGNDEIIAGYRGSPYGLYLYRYATDSKSWKCDPVDVGGTAVAGLIPADLNQDGFMDIVATGTSTNNVVWYENLTAKQSINARGN